ncbi:leucine-rich repeat protein 1-like [Daucus carota subsp. sativus]|uniref:leucine-rich repeat protein 1-like n=1 Tax=Daucus carota subsp. sativus TaxID=79200 RepID=UPI003083E16F
MGTLVTQICLVFWYLISENSSISNIWIIPPTLGKLQSLIFLRLSNNRLVGRIPMELVNVSTLKVVADAFKWKGR